MEYAAEHPEDPAVLPWASDFHDTAGEHMENMIAWHEVQFVARYCRHESVEEWIADTPVVY
ncbi:uncharacterized protein Z519_10656 [Cladophialophora bantiana CBS 173.52]|uniref:Uncharacterized protein n=1 Tax=Cladophialophora bantiana (strain ATCC 10958 / CBS 173.52 / CDC B-1940 / NIH 8579) TaxID=1442370 RepID=A0A0D2HCI5_CLAB1|nr:uncharacterized protein Z519_10656 [Cladophialophora bantiana CBS 173.52]KIW88610.1 hypothetical protein Z519_10656 [Cladophialophora bantiana CBS 173.52]